MKLPYTRGELLGIGVVALFFVIAQYYARHYAVEIQAIIGMERQGVGMALYGLIAFCAIVVAPISSLPLVPIAAAAWGSFTTVLVTMVAWTAGSIVAFLLARTYGRRVIGKVVDIGSMRKLENMLGVERIFVSTILLRMIVPVDILSYALGLFSTIRLAPYIVATVIGIVPFVIFFSYAIQMPVYAQIGIATGIIAAVLALLNRRQAI